MREGWGKLKGRLDKLEGVDRQEGRADALEKLDEARGINRTGGRGG